jgi:hypothetical protein
LKTLEEQFDSVCKTINDLGEVFAQMSKLTTRIDFSENTRGKFR